MRLKDGKLGNIRAGSFSTIAFPRSTCGSIGAWIGRRSGAACEGAVRATVDDKDAGAVFSGAQRSCLGGQATRRLRLCMCEETTHRITTDSAPGGRGLRPGGQLLDNNALNASLHGRRRRRVIVVNTLSPPIVSHSIVHAWYAGRRMSSARNETLEGCDPIIPLRPLR